jgi:hypothetical protein
MKLQSQEPLHFQNGLLEDVVIGCIQRPMQPSGCLVGCAHANHAHANHAHANHQRPQCQPVICYNHETLTIRFHSQYRSDTCVELPSSIDVFAEALKACSEAAQLCFPVHSSNQRKNDIATTSIAAVFQLIKQPCEGLVTLASTLRCDPLFDFLFAEAFSANAVYEPGREGMWGRYCESLQCQSNRPIVRPPWGAPPSRPSLQQDDAGTQNGGYNEATIQNDYEQLIKKILSFIKRGQNLFCLQMSVSGFNRTVPDCNFSSSF